MKISALWWHFQATGRALVSPAVTTCTPNDRCIYTAFQWLDGFFDACRDCRIDAIGLVS